jgi:tetratricopeptide (TPR) repeat protein
VSLRSPFAFLALLALLALPFGAVACTRRAPLDAVSAFEQANRTLLEAKSADDALRAVAQFETALARGGENGAVLHGLGNAWMKAGRKGEAIAAWRRALRYIPRDPYLRANLEQALGRRLADEERPLLRTLLFWQESLSYPEKGRALVTAMALTCALFLLTRLQPRTRALLRPAALALAAVTLLAALSFAVDVRDVDFTVHGAVTADDTVARKGNAASFEPAFNEPLRAGAEFVVLERRGEWLRARVRDGLEGWLPSERTTTW